MNAFIRPSSLSGPAGLESPPPSKNWFAVDISINNFAGANRPETQNYVIMILCAISGLVLVMRAEIMNDNKCYVLRVMREAPIPGGYNLIDLLACMIYDICYMNTTYVRRISSVV